MSHFSMTVFCVQCCGLAIVRIGCIADLAFMEESLGERKIRLASVGTGVFVGLATSAVLTFEGQMVSGLIKLFDADTAQTVPSKSKLSPTVIRLPKLLAKLAIESSQFGQNLTLALPLMRQENLTFLEWRLKSENTKTTH